MNDEVRLLQETFFLPVRVCPDPRSTLHTGQEGHHSTDTLHITTSGNLALINLNSSEVSLSVK